MSRTEKLLIDFLDLIYSGTPEFYHYSYYDLHENTKDVPKKILKINNSPIFEVRKSDKFVIKNNFYEPTDYILNLSEAFEKNVTNFFGYVPNLKEIVFTWILNKELKEYDIYNL